MITSIKYNVCLNRNGYTDKEGARQIIIELYQRGRRRIINTHIHVLPKDFAYGYVQATHPDYDIINKRIRRTIRKLMELEDEMLEKDLEPTPERIINAFIHHQTPSATVSDWIESIIYPSQRSATTKKIYATLGVSLNTFHPNIRLGDITYDFIERWQNWMHDDRNLCQNTISCRLKALRCLVNEAIKRDIIRADHDPFRNVRIPEITPRYEHLSTSELEALEMINFNIPHKQKVRDAFLFCCYTGLRWSDFHSLSSDNIHTTPTGVVTLSIKQQKTKRPILLPLSSLFNGKPLSIIQRYKTIERLTCIGDNKNANTILKTIGIEAGITKHLHWHLARHTCATLLNQHGLRMQEIQYILGHRKQETTERHYAQTLFEQVSHSLTTAFQE